MPVVVVRLAKGGVESVENVDLAVVEILAADTVTADVDDEKVGGWVLVERLKAVEILAVGTLTVEDVGAIER